MLSKLSLKSIIELPLLTRKNVIAITISNRSAYVTDFALYLCVISRNIVAFASQPVQGKFPPHALSSFKLACWMVAVEVPHNVVNLNAYEKKVFASRLCEY